MKITPIVLEVREIDKVNAEYDEVKLAAINGGKPGSKTMTVLVPPGSYTVGDLFRFDPFSSDYYAATTNPNYPNQVNPTNPNYPNPNYPTNLNPNNPNYLDNPSNPNNPLNLNPNLNRPDNPGAITPSTPARTILTSNLGAGVDLSPGTPTPNVSNDEFLKNLELERKKEAAEKANKFPGE